MSSAKIYFDTQVFSDIYHRRWPYDDLDLSPLYEAVRKRTVSLLLSSLNIEELLPRLKLNSDVGWRQIRFLLELADLNNMVKHPSEIVEDDIKTYALTGFLAAPFIGESERLKNIKAGIRNLLLCPSDENRQILLSWVGEAKARAKDQMTIAGKNQLTIRQTILNNPDTKAICREIPIVKNPVWINVAERLVASFAERCGVKVECENRGLNGLLKIKSIRMAIWQQLALIHSQLFGDSYNAEESDPKDTQHAISAAAAANVFVIHDHHFKKTVQAVNLEGLKVLDLAELIDFLALDGSLSN